MENKYDITIIGSGLSGLICAYILSKEGYSVCVLEKNRQVGGCLQTFVRDKCIFDAGVHYIGGLSEGQTLHQMFRYFGIMDRLKIKQMDKDAFDVISFDQDENEYCFAQGYDRFIEQMSKHFPAERSSIEHFIQLIKEACDNFPLYNLEIHKEYPQTFEHMTVNAQEVIESITTNKKLQAVLAGNNILYGGVGAVTPFYLYAMVINGYIQSSWRCIDGGSQIARLLVQQIRRNGGKIFKRKEVDYFTFEGKKIASIVLTNKEEIHTNEVIFSVHPNQLANFVRFDKGKLRKAYLNRIQNIKATTSVFSAHYILKPNTVKYLNRNYYHNKTEDMWNIIEHNHQNWPMNYLALTPAVSKKGEYADSLAVMTYMKYEEVQQWEDSFNMVGQESERGQAYEDFKVQKAQILLDEVCKRFPQFKGNVISTHISTPLSFRDYIGSPTGSLYGFLRDCNDPMSTSVAVQTKIPNLKLTGQNVNVHGIFGVTVSAILTAMQYVDRAKLLNDIVNA